MYYLLKLCKLFGINRQSFFKKYLFLSFHSVAKMLIFHEISHCFLPTQNFQVNEGWQLDCFKYMFSLHSNIFFIWFLLIRQKVPCPINLSLSVSFKHYSVNDPLLGEVNNKNKNLTNNCLPSCVHNVLKYLYFYSYIKLIK